MLVDFRNDPILLGEGSTEYVYLPFNQRPVTGPWVKERYTRRGVTSNSQGYRRPEGVPFFRFSGSTHDLTENIESELVVCDS